MRTGWLWLSLSLAVAPVTPAPFPPAAGRDQVVIAYSEPNNLSYLFDEGLADDLVYPATLFTKDVQWDMAWKPFPQGVEYLPSPKDGTWKVDGERMVLRWKIRPRRWHDGRPVTCGDYVFSHQLARDERVPIVVSRTTTNRIASVTCPRGAEGTEVEVHYRERDAFANMRITQFGAVPRHVLQPIYRLRPSRLAETHGIDPRYTIGDGPYRLVEWRRGESITMEAVSDHGIFGTPAIRRITWDFLRGVRIPFIDYPLSGRIDVAPISPEGAMRLEREAAGRFKVLSEEGLWWEHIDFNLDNPLLQDVRVRRAIAHGINRTQISQQLFEGRQPVSHTYLPRKHPGYTGAVPRYPYDPARARALLREAGFAPGPDGIMQNAAGQRLVLEISTTAGNRIRERTQQIIREQLRDVGIEITIVNFPFRVFFGEIVDRRKFKAMTMYTFVFLPTSTCRNVYTSDAIPSESNGWTGYNNTGYRNPEMDRLCTEASREVDDARRNRLLNETAVIFSRDLPALPLFNRLVFRAAKVGLQNYTAHPLPPAYMMWNVHKWYWR